MSLPPRFLGLVTKSALAEMLALTYAETRNVDPNEAYGVLIEGLSDVAIIDGIQVQIWRALSEKRPRLDAAGIVELVEKKLTKPKRFKAAKPSRKNAGGLAAFTIRIDQRAGISSGEALDLLYTPEGERLYAEGLRLIGEHLANEMLR